MRETTIPLATKKPRALSANGNGKRSDLKSLRVSSDKTGEARLRLILGAMVAFRDGDFSVRLPVDWAETEGLIAGAFHQVIAQKERISAELTRLSETVGKHGRLKQRMTLPGSIGGWAADADSMNTLIDDLVRPTTE